MSAEPRAATDRDLDARRAEARERMRAGVEALRSSEGWRRWAEVRSRFHSYSLANTLLIHAQRGDATLVAGYRRWQELGRQVRRGEQAIRIFAPHMRWVADEETGERVRRRVGWLVVPVFDVASTDGPPLPEPPRPELLTGSSHAGHWEPLVRAAAEDGISVSLGDTGRADGYYRASTREIVVSKGLAPNGQVATLLHELAHAHGASYERFGRRDAEVIAETAAFVAASSIGLATDRNSVPYVASWASADIESLERCAGAVDEIAARLERSLGLERGRAERERKGTRETTPAPGDVTYVGERAPDGTARVLVVRGELRESLPHLVHHSPTGMAWGHPGAGTADTARSIVGHALGRDDPEPELYRALMRDLLVRAPTEGFEITTEELRRWTTRHLDRDRDNGAR